MVNFFVTAVSHKKLAVVIIVQQWYLGKILMFDKLIVRCVTVYHNYDEFNNNNMCCCSSLTLSLAQLFLIHIDFLSVV